MKPSYVISDESTRLRVINLISALNTEKPWRVTVERYTKRRTLAQNGLYWKWIDDIVQHVHEHTGHSKDEIHEWCKKQFLPAKIIEIDGKICEYRSTKHLSTTEMKDYADKVYWWAQTMWGLILPLPEELQRIDR